MTDSQHSLVWVVIPAAGIGQRMQSELPKQYLKIGDKTLIEHTLDCFLEHHQVAGIVVVLSATDSHWQALDVRATSTPILTVKGGLNRSDSVMQGLKHLLEVQKVSKHSWVVVHDAARPCLSKTDLDALLTLRKTDVVGGLLASPVRDTIKRAMAVDKSKIDKVKQRYSKVLRTESRESLWHALTPQIFRLGELQDALTHCKDKKIKVTDESSALEFMGEKPRLIECLTNNIKVTHVSDLAFAEFLLSNNKTNEE